MTLKTTIHQLNYSYASLFEDGGWGSGRVCLLDSKYSQEPAGLKQTTEQNRGKYDENQARLLGVGSLGVGSVRMTGEWVRV